MAGWVRWWRVVVVWLPGSSPTGDREQVVDAHTVAELRALRDWALRDPRVVNYRYWLHRDWDPGDSPAVCPGCRTTWLPVQVHDDRCTCGGHRTWRCGRCQVTITRPDRGLGCAPLPADPGDPTTSHHR